MAECPASGIRAGGHKSPDAGERLPALRRADHDGTVSRVLFHGGNVFDGRRHLGRADVLVDGGRVVEIGLGGSERRAQARLRTSATEVVDVPGLLSPGFTDAHVHPIQGGLERLRCDLSELETRDDYLAAIRRTPTAVPTRSGSSAGAGRCRPSRAAPRSPAISTRGRATVRCSCPTATTTAPGSTAGRSSSPAITTRHARPAGRADRAGRRRPPDRDAPRGRDARSSRGSSRAPPTPSTTRPCSRASAYLHSLGITGWQDAIVGSYSGMDDPASTYLDTAPRGDSARTSSARSGGTGDRASSRSRTWSGGARRWPRAGSGRRA